MVGCNSRQSIGVYTRGTPVDLGQLWSEGGLLLGGWEGMGVFCDLNSLQRMINHKIIRTRSKTTVNINITPKLAVQIFVSTDCDCVNVHTATQL